MFTLWHDAATPRQPAVSQQRSDATGVSTKPLLSNSNTVLAPLARALYSSTSTLNWLLGASHSASADDVRREKELADRKSLLSLTLSTATTLGQWRNAAAELDKLEGNNLWKEELESQEYNYTLVQSRLLQLEDARTARDTERMLFIIRTSLTRHLGGMGNLRLYKHSHTGTKRLIERYIASTLDTLDALLDLTQNLQCRPIEPRRLLEQVLAARQAFGRSALLLSGGGTFGMNHIGVVKCLFENKLLPRIVSGSSAGSIVSAVLCTRTDDELPGVIEEFCYGDLAVFTKKGETDGLLQQLSRFVKIGAMFDISNLIRVMRNLLGDMTFQEAYNRTRRILNICVSSASLFELPRLLNYVTSPNVIIWSAVAASCSVPVIFTPASLLAKDPKNGVASPWNPSPQRWIDGSVDGDLPMTRLAEIFNVNHFIVSQVNPHVIPFLAKEEDSVAADAKKDLPVQVGPTRMQALAGLAKDEAMHRMQIMAEMGILPNVLTKARSVLNQKYSGDITILPDVSYHEFPKVLSNPSTEFMLAATLHGERATWPKLSRIRNHCAIELALDDAVQHIRSRIVFSPSQVDLRLSSMSRPSDRVVGRPRTKTIADEQKRLKASASEDFHERRGSVRPQPNSLATRPPTPKNPPVRSSNPVFQFTLNTRSKSSPPSSDDDDDSDAASYSSYSSESEDEEQDIDDPSLIPTEPPSPTSANRRLFPFYSQPATPALMQHRFFPPFEPPSPRSPDIHRIASSTLSMTNVPPNTIVPSGAAVARQPTFSGLSRLKHAHTAAEVSNAKRDLSQRRLGLRQTQTSGGSMEMQMPRLEIDVSGTRGMLLRKKRSLSFSRSGGSSPHS